MEYALFILKVKVKVKVQVQIHLHGVSLSSIVQALTLSSTQPQLRQSQSIHYCSYSYLQQASPDTHIPRSQTYKSEISYENSFPSTKLVIYPINN